jgi:amidase
MPFQEYDQYDMLGLADLVRRRAVSAGEVLAAAIDRIEQRNPRLNAVVLRLDDQARAQVAAGLPEGPLSGAPYLLKDLYQPYAGAPVSNGSRLFDGFVAPIDGTLTERLKAAGIVILGRTNTPEFGLNAATEPVRFGPTRNPWNLKRSAGGSSGGAAAAVASGMVPAAHATDGGGSIRIPASNCGLFGLKPTRGRNPAGPDVGEGWSGMVAGHAVTRSVRDAAALLDATSGAAPGDPYWAPPPRRPFLAEVGADPGKLRIALATRHVGGGKVAPDCLAAVKQAASLLAELGHHVEEAEPSFDAEAAVKAIRVIIGGNLATAIAIRLAGLGRKALAPGEVETISALWAEEGRRTTAADYALAVLTMHRIGRRFGEFFGKYDVLLQPVLANPPLPLGAIDMMGDSLDDYVTTLFDQICFTPQFNVTGGPAASVPFHWTAEGLPVGIQIAADFGNEALLLRLAGQIEAARPWFDRRPPPT